MSKHLYRTEYTEGVNMAVELNGITTLLCPFSSETSSQRLTMFSAHLCQHQVIKGSELPLIFTGYESKIGEYEFNAADRDQGIQILAVIPKFTIGIGVYPIKENPKHTVIYLGDDGKVGYFDLDKYTFCSDGFGFENVFLNPTLVNVGNYIPKDVKLVTSEAHKGPLYGYGTNLNTVYLSHPWVTEDAFAISESAARKLEPTAYKTISFKIGPGQIPKNLYGDGAGYKFMPDVGEYVREDGVLCALMTPRMESFISDMSPSNLSTLQSVHDNLICINPNSKILDIEVAVNRKCRIKAPDIYSQMEKYKEQENAYCLKVWEVYRRVQNEGREITQAFSNLVYRCLNNLIADGVKTPGYNKKSDVTLVKKKEAIEFLHITVKYKHPYTIKNGFKITGRVGNKGVLSKIVPDEEMPVDDYGIRADVIADPASVFNRMNTGQWYEQFINRGSLIVVQNAKMHFESNNRSDTAALEGFAAILEYVRDVSPKYADLIERVHPADGDKIAYFYQILNKGLHIQVTPYQGNITTDLVLYLREKYGIHKTPVTFVATRPDGSKRVVRTKKAAMIGPLYFEVLYKMPSAKSAGLAYCNQYGTPMKATSAAKQHSLNNNGASRYGEDEIRNIIMVAGAVEALRILGIYGNSPEARNILSVHLLYSENPGMLKRIPISTENIVRTNTILNVAKHMFSCIGIDVTAKTEPMMENPYGNLEI